MLDSNQRKTVLQTARIAALAMPLIGWAYAHPSRSQLFINSRKTPVTVT